MKQSQGKLFNYFQSSKNKSDVKKEDIPLVQEQQINNQFVKEEEDRETKKSTQRLRKLQISDDEDQEQQIKKKINNAFSNQKLMSPQQKQLKVPTNTQKQQTEQHQPQKSLVKDTPQFGQIAAENVNQENQEAYRLFDDRTPEWAYGAGVRDKNGKRADEVGYDPTTLFIDPRELAKMTPTMRQFWKIKSTNFDKIILFKLGKFYEIFYEDAVICNKYLDLNWMRNKMHVGFPEKALDKFASTLVHLGFKVAIVEQMETPAQQTERLKEEKRKSIKQEKTIKREVVEIMTKGTFKESMEEKTGEKGNERSGENKYLMVVRQEGPNIGAVLLECSTDQIIWVELQQDKYLEQFKTIVQQVRPVEVVVDIDNLSKDMQSVLSNSQWQPVVSQQPSNQLQWHQGIAITHLQKVAPSVFNVLQQKQLVLQAMAGMFTYLKSILILESVLTLATFQQYSWNDVNKYLILDSQCLDHLEIMTSSLSTPSQPYKGSVYGQLNQCRTPMGSRLLKRWLMAPLLHIPAIVLRQQAIQTLEDYRYERDAFRAALYRIGDVERLASQVYALNIRNKKAAIYFEDVNTRNLKLFHQLVTTLDLTYSLITDLQQGLQGQKGDIASRISCLVSTDLPDIQQELAEFRGAVIVTNTKDKKVYSCNMKNRNTLVRRREIEQALEEYLETQRQRLGDQRLTYIHSKYTYELEVADHLVCKNKKPADYEFTSKRAGYQRFQTSFIRQQVKLMEQLEGLEEQETREWIAQLLDKFYSKYRVWGKLIEIIGELDCLASLSVVSFNTPNMVRPTLCEEQGLIDLKGLVHPILQTEQRTFIANDIYIEQNAPVVLLTGPNMGGKSTLLRSLAIAVIMGQMGCHVCAQIATFCPVDRIFTRLGASDKLMEGKSTFYIELEETLCLLTSATPHSLCILDELGRGTSTFDGISIAYSCLQYLLQKVKARTFFSTHYHTIIQDFQLHPAVVFCTMGYAFRDHQLIHLYKLVKGVTTNSFGIDVAKIAGVQQEILDKSRIMSQEFQQKMFENNQDYDRISLEIQKLLQ